MVDALLRASSSMQSRLVVRAGMIDKLYYTTKQNVMVWLSGYMQLNDTHTHISV